MYKSAHVVGPHGPNPTLSAMPHLDLIVGFNSKLRQQPCVTWIICSLRHRRSRLILPSVRFRAFFLFSSLQALVMGNAAYQISSGSSRHASLPLSKIAMESKLMKIDLQGSPRMPCIGRQTRVGFQPWSKLFRNSQVKPFVFPHGLRRTVTGRSGPQVR